MAEGAERPHVLAQGLLLLPGPQHKWQSLEEVKSCPRTHCQPRCTGCRWPEARPGCLSGHSGHLPVLCSYRGPAFWLGMFPSRECGVWTNGSLQPLQGRASGGTMLPGHLATVRCPPGLCPCSQRGTVDTCPVLCQMPTANKRTWALGDRCPCPGCHQPPVILRMGQLRLCCSIPTQLLWSCVFWEPWCPGHGHVWSEVPAVEGSQFEALHHILMALQHSQGLSTTSPGFPSHSMGLSIILPCFSSLYFSCPAPLLFYKHAAPAQPTFQPPRVQTHVPGGLVGLPGHLLALCSWCLLGWLLPLVQACSLPWVSPPALSHLC